METIKNYLETMFMNLPKTVEVNRAKEELATMMEDKYNQLKAEGKTENEAIGIVISEFGNLDEISKELGIENYVDVGKDGIVKRKVSLQEAKQYIDTTVKSATYIAIGVMLCICSPIIIIILGGMQEAGRGITNTGVAVGGLIPMFLLIAIAVGLFIYFGMTLNKYEYLQKESFQMEFSTDSYIRQQHDDNKGNFAIKIATGVILCILGVLPVCVVGTAYEEDTMMQAISVVCLLLVVSVAVLLFITAGLKEGCYKVLLQEGDYTEDRKGGSKLADMIASIYWPVVTCIYLGWSFITSDWGFSWIIWPIAGVLFWAIASACGIAEKNRK